MLRNSRNPCVYEMMKTYLSIAVAVFLVLSLPTAGHSAPLVEPGAALDEPSDTYAEGEQGDILLARGGDVVVAAYWDDRDSAVHLVAIGDQWQGASRRSVALDQGVSLEDAYLAGSPNGFVLVWAREGDISALRFTVDELGELSLSAPTNVAADATAYSQPRATWGPNQWLVAYRSGGAERGSVRRGLLPTTGPFTEISGELATDVSGFALVGTEIEYGLVYEDGDHVVLIEMNALSAETNRTEITSVLPDMRVEASHSGGSGWAIWYLSDGQVFGRRLNSELQSVGADVIVTELGVSAREGQVAVHGDKARFLWTQDGALMARSHNGSSFGDPVVVSDGPSLGSAITITEEGVVVASVENVEGGNEILLTPIHGENPGAASTMTVGTGPRLDAAAVWTGTDYVVAWSEISRTRASDVFFRSVDNDGLPSSDIRVLAQSEAGENSVAAAVGSVLLLIWVEDQTSLRGRRFALTEGLPEAGDPFLICEEPGGLANPNTITLDGEFLVTWEDGRGDSAEIGHRQIPADGAVTEDCGATLGEEGVENLEPSAVRTATGTAVIWRTSAGGVNLVSLSQDGTPGDRVVLVDPAADVTEASAVRFGDAFLLASVRTDSVNEGQDVFLTTFELDGPNEEFVIENANGTDSGVVLVGGASTISIVWLHEETGSVRYQQYSAAGLIGDAPFELVASPPAVLGPLDLVAGPAGEIGLTHNSADRSPFRNDPRLTFRRVLEGSGVTADAGGSYSGRQGDLIRLDGSGSQPEAVIDAYEWRSPNGVAGIEVAFDHVFAETGVFDLQLTVTDTESGATDVDVVEVSIENVRPTMAITSVPGEVFEGQEVPLEVTIADPGGLDTVTLEWSFGIGSPVVGLATEVASVRKTFPEGNFTVCVTATDHADASVEDCIEIEVKNASPTIVFDPSTYESNEGDEVTFLFTLDDGGDDPLTTTWEFGDGESTEASAAAPYPSQIAHTYVDDRAEAYEACLTAIDDATAETKVCVAVTVNNVAPSFVGIPAGVAIEGLDEGGDPLQYRAVLEVVDPGPEDVTVEFSSGGLPDVSYELSDDSAEVTITFTPTIEQWALRTDHTWRFALTGDEGGGGDPTVLEWDIIIALQDKDSDGLPDTCERLYDLTGPEDTGAADFDGDGVGNADECTSGSNPKVDDRPPTAPTLNAPTRGSTVETLEISLSVLNLPEPEEVTYTYEFELYTAEDLNPGSLVGSNQIRRQEGTVTAWQPSGFVDRQIYYWRARATNNRFFGPWMAVADFTVVLPNWEPTVPVPLAPTGELDVVDPEFSWESSIDPEGEAVTYTLEIHNAFDMSDRERVVESIEDQADVTDYQIPEEAPLADNGTYYWRVKAVDERGAESDWSAPMEISVNAFNDLPGTPTIVSPEVGASVTTRFPELIVTAVEDIDGDDITYAFVVSADDSFSDLVDRATDVVPDAADGNVHHTVNRELNENQRYLWRAAARDRLRLGGFVAGEFFVNAQNDPPLPPTFQSPSAGESVTDERPTLTIRNTTDPDGDSVTYDFQVSSRSNFAELIFHAEDVEEGETETSVVVDAELVQGEAYYTRARGVDEFGAEGAWSAIVQFRMFTTTQIPDPPVPVLPEFGATLQTGTVELGVENVESEAPEDPTYEFAVYSDQMLEDQIYFADGVPEDVEGMTVHRVSDRLSAGQYFWNARVRIGETVSPWSDTSLFEIDFGQGSGDGVSDDLAGLDVEGGDAGNTGSLDPATTPPEGCCATVPTKSRPERSLAFMILLSWWGWRRVRRRRPSSSVQ